MGKVKQSQNHKQEVTWKALKNIHVQPQNCNKTMNPGYVLLSKDQGNTVENTCTVYLQKERYNFESIRGHILFID